MISSFLELLLYEGSAFFEKLFEFSLYLFEEVFFYFFFILKFSICFGKIKTKLGSVNNSAIIQCHSKTLTIPKKTPMVSSKKVNL